MSVLLIRNREDTVFVALGLALDLFCLDFDAEGSFDDPGKQAGRAVTDRFAHIAE